MREIKFRGKRIDNGEWVYGYLFVDTRQGTWILVNKTPNEEEKNGLQQFESFLVDQKTVGQFTTYYDKDEKELYEWDLIITYDCGGPEVIAWSHDRFTWSMYSSLKNMDDLFNRGVGIDKVDWRNIEKVGNLFDNLELFEKK